MVDGAADIVELEAVGVFAPVAAVVLAAPISSSLSDSSCTSRRFRLRLPTSDPVGVALPLPVTLAAGDGVAVATDARDNAVITGAVGTVTTVASGFLATAALAFTLDACCCGVARRAVALWVARADNGCCSGCSAREPSVPLFISSERSVKFSVVGGLAAATQN